MEGIRRKKASELHSEIRKQQRFKKTNSRHTKKVSAQHTNKTFKLEEEIWSYKLQEQNISVQIQPERRKDRKRVI